MKLESKKSIFQYHIQKMFKNNHTIFSQYLTISNITLLLLVQIDLFIISNLFLFILVFEWRAGGPIGITHLCGGLGHFVVDFVKKFLLRTN